MTDDTADGRAPSRHLSQWIDADPGAVYAFASDPGELARWAAGLANPALADADVRFATRNDFGVLDHVVRLPSGDSVYNPMRVIPAGTGEQGCEVIFTLRRRASPYPGDAFGAYAGRRQAVLRSADRS